MSKYQSELQKEKEMATYSDIEHEESFRKA